MKSNQSTKDFILKKSLAMMSTSNKPCTVLNMSRMSLNMNTTMMRKLLKSTLLPDLNTTSERIEGNWTEYTYLSERTSNGVDHSLVEKHLDHLGLLHNLHPETLVRSP